MQYGGDSNDVAEAFVQAAGRNDTDTVIALYARGMIADVNVCDRLKWTALLYAAIHGNMVLVDFLLSKGASTSIRSHQGLTPLHFAAIQGHYAVVRRLVNCGAKVDSKGLYNVTPTFDTANSLMGSAGVTPLDLATSHQHHEIATFLLERSDLNTCRVHELRKAAEDGDLRAVRLLISDGADVLAQSFYGETPFINACSRGDTEVVYAMIEVLDEMNRADTKRSMMEMPQLGKATPLNIASGYGHIDIVIFLVEHKVALECQTVGGFSPLHSAVERNHPDVVEFLTAKGADLETRNVGGSTPLITAVVRGFTEMVEQLLVLGADADSQSIDGYSPLILASHYGNLKIVNLLLNHGASLDTLTDKKTTALLAAVMNGHVDVLELLLQHKANIQVQSEDGSTPVIMAARADQIESCRVLIAAGSPISSCNMDGQSALHIAAKNGNKELVEILIEGKADPDVVDYNGHTPAYLAAFGLNFDIVEYLIERMKVSIDVPHEVWTVATIQELSGMPVEQDVVQPDPNWYVDASTIKFGTPNQHLFAGNFQVLDGEWLGSPVTIIRPNEVWNSSSPILKQETLANFCADIRKWYPLNHPHVIKLFGACHRGQQLMITESLVQGNLRSYLELHPHRKWRVLHQVALGLQYLHERGIIHRFVSGFNILISADGSAKLAGICNGARSILSASMHWMSPERVNGSASSYESDIYGLGMCIIEAVSGKLPYAVEEAKEIDLKGRILTGVLPLRHQLFCDRGWDLVARMCRCQSRERLKIADVVRELELLSKDEGATYLPQLSASQVSEYNSGADMEAMEESLSIALSCINEQREADIGLEFRVFQRLNDIWNQLQLAGNGSTDIASTIARRYCEIADRFVSELNMHRITSSMESYAAGRQRAETEFALLNEIDRVMKVLELDMSSEIHTWRSEWHEERTDRLRAFAAVLQDMETLQSRADNVKLLTCLLFELTSHRMSYTPIEPQIVNQACVKIRSTPGVQVAEWFIPPYEVVFDQVDNFSSGSFGSVHHGTWMGSSIVVKKVLVEDDDAFQREVGIWFRLYHPFVVRLFGACHVGQKFFVCEYASQGHLKEYLQQIGKRKARRVVWRRLYESALGLQYLHALKVQHRDLTCKNILVGLDGVAKLADFGLSSIKPEPLALPDGKQIGAVRMRAPEILNGKEPSPESDIYGFAMCIVEAVSGDYPWKGFSDTAVKARVRDGSFFKKPTNFSDAQWDLIQRMCYLDRSERMKLDEVIANLQMFAAEAEQMGAVLSSDEEEEEMRSSEPENEASATTFLRCNSNTALSSTSTDHGNKCEVYSDSTTAINTGSATIDSSSTTAINNSSATFDNSSTSSL